MMLKKIKTVSLKKISYLLLFALLICNFVNFAPVNNIIANADTTITIVLPAAGPSYGGTWVTIDGSGFGDDLSRVEFDGVPVCVVAWSTTQITVISPQHTNSTDFDTVDITLFTSTDLVNPVYTLPHGFGYYAYLNPPDDPDDPPLPPIPQVNPYS